MLDLGLLEGGTRLPRIDTLVKLAGSLDVKHPHLLAIEAPQRRASTPFGGRAQAPLTPTAWRRWLGK
jgi:hypothetical protein